MFGLTKGARRSIPRRRRKLTAMAVVAVLGSAMLAACGGGGAASTSDTLTVALPGWTPDNFDLPKVYHSPIFQVAYEPLIQLSPSGEYAPGVAESWEYEDNNTAFTMKIRDGVKFADGTDLTVKSVVDTLNHFISVPGLNDGFVKLWTVEAVGEDSVRINFDKPFRGAEQLLSTDNYGMVISEAGLKNPAKLKSDMFGAGPYEYVAGESEPGDHYTFRPNPNYYDKSRQHWEEIEFRVIGDENTAFNALATGQVQVAKFADGSALLSQAESKGIDVEEDLTWCSALMVWDRAGEVSKPLADTRVRQAMAFALDRESIASVQGKAATPADQFAVPGLVGADPDLPSKYSYNIEKAKQLMADAGYEDGFSVTMLTNTDDPQASTPVGAAVEQLAKIGIRVERKSLPDSTYYSEIATKKYPLGAVSWGMAGDVVYSANRLYELPYSAVWNPFASVDPDLDRAYDDLVTADDSTVEDSAKKFNEVMTEKAWYIPMTCLPNYVFGKGIELGTSGSFGAFDVASWRPKN